MKTPGVYIVEKKAFQNSIVEVETAIPAFIGTTTKAINGKESLKTKPWRISSIREFKECFVNEEAIVKQEKPTLFHHILLFFANGGGTCYIVSVDKIDEVSVKPALTALEYEQDVTLIAVPEAAQEVEDECYKIQKEVLNHCVKMKNRFAILDVPDTPGNFQKNIGGKNKLGAAYYPKLKTSVVYDVNNELKEKLHVLPPSAAIAGVYAKVDAERGVWKAPANVSLSYVSAPSIIISDDDQTTLNDPENGIAINAIRTFLGEGVKVWGARTLDSVQLDDRYINVRRTLLFLEESIKNGARTYVFEPNDANTWLSLKCMIENFLHGVWKKGGLVGSTPAEAYRVHVGLGETMTSNDILEGIINITVLVAISHPAEFIEITFQQQMQTS